jgi:GTPase SAR1 family protein
MGCRQSNSKESKQEHDRARQIDAQLRNEAEIGRKVYKLLLLGTGDSGKSTFLKQLKTVHKDNGAVLATDQAQFATVLPQNALETAQDLIRGLTQLENRTLAPEYMNMLSLTLTEFDEKVAIQIEKLWALPESKSLFERRNEVDLIMHTAAPYYFQNVRRFSALDFLPTAEDILRARLKTTGIKEVKFDMGDEQFIIVDVGGQRSERRKWLHCFDNVTCIIYLTSLDEYDMKLVEDHKTNRMEESLDLFRQVTGSQIFQDSNVSWILFLNKSDLFAEKIKRRPLHKYFPTEITEADSNDFDKAVKLIQGKYETRFHGKRLYCFTTTAIDTKNVERVFNAIRDTVLTNALSEMDKLAV